MSGNEERVSSPVELLSRYLDREMTPQEASAFEARLGDDASLRRELQELRAVGAALRRWSRDAEERAADLLEPTLARARSEAQRETRHTRFGYALAALVVALLPWTRFDSTLATEGVGTSGAAIERIEAGDKSAQVFMVGSAQTPVLWLADDAPEDSSLDAQDPG